MKLKKRFKNISIFLLALGASCISVGTVFGIVSCNNISNHSENNAAKNFDLKQGEAVVYGKLTSDKIPSPPNDNFSRTAIPDPSSFTAIASYSVTATNSSGNSKSADIDTTTNPPTFSIKLPYGTWNITAIAKDVSQNTILEKTKTVILDENNQGISADFRFSYAEEGTTGNISLKISFPPNVKSVKSTLGTETISASSAQIAAGKITIEKNDVAVGAYDLIVYFYGTSDEILYRIDQVVNVYTGKTTNYFYNAGSYYTISSGGIEITETNIKNFMASTFYVGGSGLTGTAASDSNSGTQFDPFATVQKALNIIKNSTLTPIGGFKIFVSGTIQATSSTQVVDFFSFTNDAKVSIIGADSSQKSVLEGNRNGVVFIGVSPKIDLTLENLKITSGSTSNGGGIHIGNATSSVTLKNCEISGNTASSNGNLILSGSTVFGADDDIYLENGKFVTISSDLMGFAPIAKITLPNYTIGDQVLKADGTNVTELSQELCDKFKLTDEYNHLELDSANTAAVIKKNIATATIALPENYNVILGGVTACPGVTPGTAVIGGTITISVTTGAEATVEPTELKVELKQNGETFKTFTSNEITIPSQLQEDFYDLHIAFTIDGQKYDVTYTIKMLSP